MRRGVPFSEIPSFLLSSLSGECIDGFERELRKETAVDSWLNGNEQDSLCLIRKGCPDSECVRGGLGDMTTISRGFCIQAKRRFYGIP